MSKVDLRQSSHRKKINIFLIILFAFALYCSIIIGETWDHDDNLVRGKITLDYLFSFGNINNDIVYREYYSTIYWSLLHLVTKQFPLQYQIEISHFINLVFSFSAIIGIGKVTGELFNKKIDINTINLKTSPFFSIAFLGGYLLSGGDQKNIGSVKTASLCFSNFFQIYDDFLDAEEDKEGNNLNQINLFGKDKSIKLFFNNINKFLKKMEYLNIDTGLYLEIIEYLKGKINLD